MKYPRQIAYNGSRGNIREIYFTEGSECPYEARFDGVHLGHYGTYENAYSAIQAALEARLEEGKPKTLIEQMRSQS